MFCLLYKRADDAVFDDFLKTADHFPKISENLTELLRRLYERFRTFFRIFSEVYRILPKIGEDNRRSCEDVSIIHEQIKV